jgi:3-hydroxyacyl-CoA dehydrogenase/enoyl-CoA hydratase/3-hydroxybutyryl-CoA epimerase
MSPESERPIITSELGADGILVAVVDHPRERFNPVTWRVLAELESLVARVESDAAVRALVVASAKPGSFLAGTDPRMFARVRDAEAGADESRALHRLFGRFAAVPKPFVCAIDGACSGAGLELALCADVRLASDDARTSFCIDELRYGLIPAAGGTQRLPRLVRVDAALELLLTGRRLDHMHARAIELVDDVVAAASVREAARARALALMSGFGRRERALPDDARGEALAAVLRTWNERLDTRARDAAARTLVGAVEHGLREGLDAGLEAEARGFGEVVVSRETRSQLHLFTLGAAAREEPLVDPTVAPVAVETVALLEAGLIGTGLSALALQAGYRVRLYDWSSARLQQGVGAVATFLGHKYRNDPSGPERVAQLVARLAATGDSRVYEGADLVIDTAVENLDPKRERLRAAEALLPEHAVWASATSAIPIVMLLDGMRRPERILGLHLFAPTYNASLLEIVTTPATAPEALATALAVTSRLGKLPLLVSDGPGFYLARVVVRFCLEGLRALEEGFSVEAIDGTAERLGFLFGPLAGLDEMGLDLAAGTARVLEWGLGERLAAPALLGRAFGEMRFGKSNGRGFYLYEEGRRGAPDPAVGALLPPERVAREPDDELGERLLYAFVGEAVRCLEDAVLRNARDGDLGAVMAMGFPASLGGPFHFVDVEGAERVERTLARLEERHGPRFAPPMLLAQRARAGETFHAADVR